MRARWSWTVLAVSATLLLGTTPVAAGTLTVYPHDLKSGVTDSNAPYSVSPNFISSWDSAYFLYPVKIPVAATVTKLKVWADSSGSQGRVQLIRAKDSVLYDAATDTVASVDFHVSGAWELWIDDADGPAPAKIAAGYRYYLYVTVKNVNVGTIQIVYTAP
jgi:hypothetical protein